MSKALQKRHEISTETVAEAVMACIVVAPKLPSDRTNYREPLRLKNFNDLKEISNYLPRHVAAHLGKSMLDAPIEFHLYNFKDELEINEAAYGNTLLKTLKGLEIEYIYFDEESVTLELAAMVAMRINVSNILMPIGKQPVSSMLLSSNYNIEDMRDLGDEEIDFE